MTLWRWILFVLASQVAGVQFKNQPVSKGKTMKWIRDNLGEIGGFLLYAFFIFATIFGIYRGFHKNVGNGVASILIPPLAWYNAVAYLWEKPDWKLEYDRQTSNLAIALISAKPEKVDEQVSLSELLQYLHGWVKILPKSESEKLKTESEKLCETWIAFEEQECDALLNNRDLVDVRVEFHSIPQFEKEFNNAAKEANLQIKTVFGNADLSQIPSDELKARFKAFLEVERLNRSQRLDKVFTASN
jgi:hypothetical protein